MIRFKCPCGHTLTAEMDEAGSSLQCPKCKRLIDVPTLDDLPNLNEDGTYAMDTIELSAAQKSKRRTFRSIHSTGGDLRPTAEEILAVGVPIEDNGPVRPRYDPFTGERVRPMDVIETPLTAEPVGPTLGSKKPRQSLAYSSEGWKREPFFLPVGALLSPANLIVLATVFFIHLVFLPFVPFFPVNLILAIFFGPPLLIIMLSHFANIVDTTGPEGNNDLPILLRGASFSQDMWHPFTQMMFSMMLVIVPTLVVTKLTGHIDGGLIGLITFGVMLVFFPAILLTAATSGTFWNLSPGRLLGTIRVCGPMYLFTVGVLFAAVIIYPVGMIMTMFAVTRLVLTAFAGASPDSVGAAFPTIPLIVQDLVAWLLLAFGIYLLHLMCYMLGMHYRKHHAQFPWMLQRHISTRSDTARKLEESRKQKAIQRGRKATEALPPI